MNFLTQFLTAICAACIFIGALYMLCPNGSMSKPVSFALSLVFVISVLAACRLTVWSDISQISISAPTAATGEEGLVISAEYVYSTALKAAGINFSKVSVLSHKNETGGISISKVIVVSSESEAKIMSALYGRAENIEVEIINE